MSNFIRSAFRLLTIVSAIAASFAAEAPRRAAAPTAGEAHVLSPFEVHPDDRG